MSPLTLHIIILVLLFIPALVTGLFYLHYRFFVREELKEIIADHSQMSLRRVHKKGNVYEDAGPVPPTKAMGILLLGTFFLFSLLWFVHVGITSLYFYLVSPTVLMIFLAHLISLFTLMMLERLNRKKSDSAY
ncbi:MAG: hypothetical protein DRR16_18640 [Candidatus Parabeggiatoa sp. nov. 3]|jgi:hypothetical protein|nr:MAG: hypothetical protein DRR00_17140 [Gammaproteobacteria bacterium]RKZ65198.1 MAG: hypothetical protein DRQ99_13325 [Gammaproteobacteria bacterium]RKZ82906.1 MAG: hypothetical protein DRR16_18640 [Gammaproteobacteria bacterium]